LLAFAKNEKSINLNHLDGASTNLDGIAKDYFSGFTPALFGRLAKKRWYRYITGESIETLTNELCQTLAQHLKSENPSFQFSEWDLNAWMGIRTDMLHYILANVGDRQEMSHSIEGRTPFLDTEVISVAGKIKETYLLRGLREKFALRQVAAKYLRKEDFLRGKKPFFAPYKYFYLRENREQIDHYIKLAKEKTPWLEWRHIESVLNSDRSNNNLALENTLVALRMTLFSLGVLSQNLRNESHLETPRGYSLPLTVEDLIPYRREVIRNVL